jgi:ribosome-associated protein
MVAEDEDERAERPSKSQRKRDAHAAQDLGERLIALREQDLAPLDLPETLLDAIRAARTIPSRGGGARQRQYIGKLMREIDPAPILAALGAQSGQAAREAQQFKRLEAWRERLLREGAAALDELERWRPGLDREQWLRQIAAAKAAGGTGVPARELFRALRTLFADAPNEEAPGTMRR